MQMEDTKDIQSDKETTTEERILRAAEVEFMQKGFAGARTTAIAEAAGVNHAMLHYYYRTKEKLFERVVSEKLSLLAETFFVSFDSDRPLEENVRGAVEKHFDLIMANPLLPRFMVCEVFANPALSEMTAGKIAAIAGQAIVGLQQKIDEISAKGECRPVSVVSLMMDIVSLNVFPVLAMPMIRRIGDKLPVDEVDDILRRRREDNVQTILRKIML